MTNLKQRIEAIDAPIAIIQKHYSSSIAKQELLYSCDKCNEKIHGDEVCCYPEYSEDDEGDEIFNGNDRWMCRTCLEEVFPCEPWQYVTIDRPASFDVIALANEIHEQYKPIINEQQRLLELMAEGLSQITELKKPDRIREDIKAMEGSFCPSFEVILEAIYKIALSRAEKTLAEYNKAMEDK